MTGKRLGIFFISLILILVTGTAVISQSREEKFANNILNTSKLEGANDIVMVIDGEEVTRADYLSAIALQDYNIEEMKLTKQELEQNNPNTENSALFINRINKKIELGKEKLAVASLIYNNTTISEGKKRGVLASNQEIQNHASKMKKIISENPKENAKIGELIAILGEDYYWNKYTPKNYQVGLTAGKLRNLISTGKNKDENDKLWHSFLYQSAASAKVEILDSCIPFNKEELNNFITSYYQDLN